MQTFLPYTDFAKCAQTLDRLRLGKQRIEVLTILRTLLDGKKGWHNHPAVKMWSGYEQALVRYGIAMCQEWRRRGYKDTTQPKIEAFLVHKSWQLPHWVGGKIHRTHQSNLLRKDYKYYRRFFLSVPLDLAYYWPRGQQYER